MTLPELENMRIKLRSRPRKPDAPPGHLPLDDLQHLRRLYFEKLNEAGRWSQEEGRGGSAFQSGRWQAWFAAIDALETLIMSALDSEEE